MNFPRVLEKRFNPTSQEIKTKEEIGNKFLSTQVRSKMTKFYLHYNLFIILISIDNIDKVTSQN